MKKSISIILAVLMLLSIFSVTATATNGPKPNLESGSACIYFSNMTDTVDDIIVYSAGEIHNDAIEGAKYDSEKNMLTLTDFNHPNLSLILEDMGDDFTINISGDCTIYNIVLRTDNYGANLNVTGKGMFIVNPEREDETAIHFIGAGAELKLHVENTVSVKFLSCENAVSFNGSSNGDKDTVFTQGDKTVEVEGGKGSVETVLTVNGAYVSRDNGTKKGYQAHQANDPNFEQGIYSVTITESATGDIYHVVKYVISDKFGVWVKDESFEEQDLTKEEFDGNFTISTQPGTTPKQIEYTDEDGEKKTGYLVEDSINGGYFVIDIDFNKDPDDNIHRAKPIEQNDSGEYYVVPTWGGYEVNNDTFFGRGLRYVYNDEFVEFEEPKIATGEFAVYKDEDGNWYVFDEEDNVYRISEDNKTTIDGKEYYVMVLWQGVTKDNLTPVTKEEENDFYDYLYPGPDYIYLAPEETPSSADTTAEETTEAPEPTTTDPQGTTADPQGTTADQQGTTTQQEEPQPTTTEAPEPTTTAPDVTRVAPTTAEPTTAAPAPTKATKSATEPTVKTVKKGSSEKQVDKFVKSLKTEKDPKGTKFGLLCAHQKKATKKSVTVKWNKLKKAKYYLVYGSLCGTKKGKIPPYKKIKKTTKTSYTKKKLKKGTYFKFLIIAFDKKNKVLASSKTVHIATKGGKVGNDKTVKLNKSKVTLKLKKKKTFTIKAKEIPQSKKQKVKRHRKIKYESSNPKVAKVNGKGKVTAKKKGTATIFVYAQNGLYKKVKVTVKKK